MWQPRLGASYLKLEFLAAVHVVWSLYYGGVCADPDSYLSVSWVGHLFGSAWRQ